MSDLIERQAAIDICANAIDLWRGQLGEGALIAVRDKIKQLPSAGPKRGKWISADAMFHGVPFYCSECGENTWDTVMGKPRWKFCPNCGADMRGEQDG